MGVGAGLDDEPTSAGAMRVLCNYLLRAESGVSVSFWDSPAAADLLGAFCACVFVTPRVAAAAQLSPALLSTLFDEVARLGSEDAACLLLPAILLRHDQLLPHEPYCAAARAVLETRLGGLFSQFPALLGRCRHAVMQYLAAGSTPATLGLHAVLVWAVGQFASPECSAAFNSEAMDDAHSTLQLLVFEQIALASSGDADAMPQAQVVPVNRFVCLLISALGKLAARSQSLTPSVVLCLSKIVDRAGAFAECVVAIAAEHIRLLQLHSVAASVLASCLSDDDDEDEETASASGDAESSLRMLLEAEASLLLPEPDLVDASADTRAASYAMHQFALE